MTRNPLDERYLNDPEFHSLVDMFRSFFREARITPADARTVVNYAAICEEMSSTRSRFVYNESTGELERVPR